MSGGPGKTRVPLKAAQNLAARIVEALLPGVERIEVAGSVRRGKPDVGDIEIVCIPARRAGLFPGQGGESLLDPLLEQLQWSGRLAPGPRLLDGEKRKKFLIPSTRSLTLDLFIVTPETWGVLLAIWTGPAEFGQAIVTPRSRGGRLRDGLTVWHGNVWRREEVTFGFESGPNSSGTFIAPRPGAKPLPTPEEKDFLELAGGWIEPCARCASAPIKEASHAA